MMVPTLLGLLLGLAPVSPPEPACAAPTATRCTCLRWRAVRSPAQADSALAQVPVIFVGRVVGLRPLADPRDPMRRQRASVLVERPLQGAVAGDTVLVDDGLGGGDCGLGMIEGGRYLLFLGTAPRASAEREAESAARVPFAGGCSGSLVAREAAREFRLLRAAQARRDSLAGRFRDP